MVASVRDALADAGEEVIREVEELWTSVTNEWAVRRPCDRHRVQTRFGLDLMVDLVGAAAITAKRVVSIAYKMHEAKPLHMNERVIARFKNALDQL